jgi:hypothetical protein
MKIIEGTYGGYSDSHEKSRHFSRSRGMIEIFMKREGEFAACDRLPVDVKDVEVVFNQEAADWINDYSGCSVVYGGFDEEEFFDHVYERGLFVVFPDGLYQVRGKPTSNADGSMTVKLNEAQLCCRRDGKPFHTHHEFWRDGGWEVMLERECDPASQVARVREALARYSMPPERAC